jgi:hypothetical protein
VGGISNTLTLREYVDARFDSQEKAVNAALAAAQKAVDKAEAASEKRFESVNEFRAALGDQARLLMPRSEAEQQFKTISEKIDVLTTRINARDDRGTGMGQVWGWLVAAIGMAVGIVGVVLAIT